MRSFIHISLYLILACSPFNHLNAQDDLTLAQAIEKALVNNYQIKIIKANLEIAETQNTWGMAGAVPTVSFNVNNTNTLSDNTNNPA